MKRASAVIIAIVVTLATVSANPVDTPPYPCNGYNETRGDPYCVGSICAGPFLQNCYKRCTTKYGPRQGAGSEEEAPGETAGAAVPSLDDVAPNPDPNNPRYLPLFSAPNCGTSILQRCYRQCDQIHGGPPGPSLHKRGHSMGVDTVNGDIYPDWAKKIAGYLAHDFNTRTFSPARETEIEWGEDARLVLGLTHMWIEELLIHGAWRHSRDAKGKDNAQKMYTYFMTTVDWYAKGVVAQDWAMMLDPKPKDKKRRDKYAEKITNAAENPESMVAAIEATPEQRETWRIALEAKGRCY